MEEFKWELSKLIRNDHVKDLTDDKLTYFKRGFETAHRTPQIYGMHKLHNKFTDYVPFRPVNSQVDLLSAVASKFVDDYYLKKILQVT